MPHNHLLDLFLMVTLIERENEMGQDVSQIFNFKTTSNVKAMSFYNKLDFFSYEDTANLNKLVCNQVSYSDISVLLKNLNPILEG